MEQLIDGKVREETRIAPITQDALTASSIRDILCISLMRRFASRMKTTLKKWGNSHGIRLPKYVLETMGWSDDEALEVLADGDKLIIKKANKHKTIDELFEGHDGGYEPTEIDWGSPQGREVW